MWLRRCVSVMSLSIATVRDGSSLHANLCFLMDALLFYCIALRCRRCLFCFYGIAWRRRGLGLPRINVVISESSLRCVPTVPDTRSLSALY